MNYTSEQNDLLLMVRDFVEKELRPVVKEYDEKNEFPITVYKKAIEIGIHCLRIPEKFGGAGLDNVTYAIISEEIAKVDPGFSVTIGANNLGTVPSKIAGTEKQQKLFTDIVVSGGFASFCLTEAEAGSDAGSCRTTATKVGDEYIINGSKCFVTNGGLANIYTVFASTDKSKRSKGLSAFIVPRDLPGVSIGKEENKMGIRTSNTTEVIFNDVKVPSKYLIGKEGDGFKIAMRTLDETRPLGSSSAVGISQAAIDHCIKYSKERVTFGKPICKNQAIQFMLADMEIQTQAARQLMLYASGLIDKGIVDSKLGSIVKTFASDTAIKVTTDAVQIFGGYGYSKDYPVEKLMRDAKIFQIFEGTNQIQRMVIAGNMLN